MQRNNDHRRSPLLPAGRRWGAGAQSVVPYLTHGRATRAPEAEEVEQLVNNPVFVHMEHTLRVLQRQH
jgi:hypothetical protein